MWHQEKIIKGELCYRKETNGQWIRYTKEEITEKYLNTKAKLIEQVHECY